MNNLGDRPVPVEMAMSARGYDRHQASIPFREFVLCAPRERGPFLAEVHLEEILPDAVRLSDVIAAAGFPRGDLRFFAGVNSYTPFHYHEGPEAVVVQLHGTKLFYIVGEAADAPRDAEGRNFLDRRLDEAWRARAERITLSPGDALRIPPWCWHAAEGRDWSISATNFWLSS